MRLWDAVLQEYTTCTVADIRRHLPCTVCITVAAFGTFSVSYNIGERKRKILREMCVHLVACRLFHSCQTAQFTKIQAVHYFIYTTNLCFRVSLTVDLRLQNRQRHVFLLRCVVFFPCDDQIPRWRNHTKCRKDLTSWNWGTGRRGSVNSVVRLSQPTWRHTDGFHVVWQSLPTF